MVPIAKANLDPYTAVRWLTARSKMKMLARRGDGAAERAGLENPDLENLELREKLRNPALTLAIPLLT